MLDSRTTSRAEIDGIDLPMVASPAPARQDAPRASLYSHATSIARWLGEQRDARKGLTLALDALSASDMGVIADISDLAERCFAVESANRDLACQLKKAEDGWDALADQHAALTKLAADDADRIALLITESTEAKQECNDWRRLAGEREADVEAMTAERDSALATNRQREAEHRTLTAERDEWKGLTAKRTEQRDALRAEVETLKTDLSALRNATAAVDTKKPTRKR